MNNRPNQFISRSFNSLDIKIGIHGFVEADRSWKCREMAIPYSKLYFVCAGEGVLEAAEEKVLLRPGGIYLVPYGLSHGFYCENRMDKLYFHLTVTKPDGRDLLEGCNRVMELHAGTDQNLALKALYDDNTAVSCFLLKQKIYHTTADFIQQFSLCTENGPEYSPTIEAAIRYIRTHLSIGLTVKQIADALFISESALTKQFSRETGCSIGRYIDELIMVEAQRALIRSNDSIKEISDQLGFCDQFYFSRKFKQCYKTTPTYYRKKHSI